MRGILQELEQTMLARARSRTATGSRLVSMVLATLKPKTLNAIWRLDYLLRRFRWLAGAKQAAANLHKYQCSGSRFLVLL